MNNETKNSQEISEDEIKQYEEKCVELAKAVGASKVHCCIQLRRDDGSFDRIVTYIKEPNYMTKLALMDKAAMVGPMNAGEEFRLLCLLKEHSNPLAHSENEEYDKYKLGVTKFCVEIIELAQNEFKKK